MVRNAVIFLNGEPPSRVLARNLARESDLIVAADGGANYLRSLGLKPDLIVGDLDSIRPATQKSFPTSRLIHLPDQDQTDLEKTLDVLKKQKIKRVSLLGATGKRIDFTLGNLVTIWKYHRSMEIEIFGNGWQAFPLKTRNRFVADVGSVVSLIPYGEVRGVTLRGLKHPLTRATLSKNSAAVSNEVVSSPFSVTLKSGNLLLLLLDRSINR